jgi:hypothetical protein
MEFAVTLKPLACGKVFFSFTGPCCPKSRIGSNYVISDICSGREDGA